MMAAPLVTVLTQESSFEADRAVAKFAEFLGLETASIAVDGLSEKSPSSLDGAALRERILVIGHSTLNRVMHRAWFAKLVDDTKFIFVYDFASATDVVPELQWLTDGVVYGVTTAENPKLATVHADVRYNHFPVCGRSYRAETGPTPIFATRESSNSRLESYVTIDGQPHFVSFFRGRSTVFLLAANGIVDIDTALSPAHGTLKPWYAQLIALSIFFRSAAGPWCWTSPVTAANFIVDDPYLKKRYGFIRYSELTRELSTSGGALTIAFIPYNFRRSDPVTIELLRQHCDRFSIAVHGCDHTGGEYASTDSAWMNAVTGRALERMEQHSALTGMSFDNVMVFPQGKFSTAAISALQSNGFDAAANSGAWPVDYGTNPLTIRDLLDVAVTRYENFPIFIRRYPTDIFDYAFDAMFQKPVLGVEHQGYFSKGYGALKEAIWRINSLGPQIRWMPLGDALASSCIMRITGENRFVVRHFASRFRFKNPSDRPMELKIEKPASKQEVIAVKMDESLIPFTEESGFVRYAITVGPQQAVKVHVVHRCPSRVPRKTTINYRLGVATRRLLSDARDNYLSRNERVLKIAEWVKSSLSARR